ncbi:Hypothetical predicted protein [Xyrichtys novacula]|uniref:Uncharacterized protein n=1 Tax=Xyrichtys novacula TaxID=13765 RepID=A0AAV1EMZ5_XYRNO|nr:Hypothetical predicted protein [Xyrichtys novacula]
MTQGQRRSRRLTSYLPTRPPLPGRPGHAPLRPRSSLNRYPFVVTVLPGETELLRPVCGDLRGSVRPDEEAGHGRILRRRPGTPCWCLGRRRVEPEAWLPW